ncbi:sugar transferase [Lactococcus garvieae]
MKRWVLNIVQGSTRDAVTKPKSDVVKIAKTLNYNKISIQMQNTREMSDQMLTVLINAVTAEISYGDIILYQYPTLLGYRFEEFFLSYLKNKGVKIMLLMHDSEWLRGIYPHESKLLNSVDVIIGHGEALTNALQSNGVNTKIIKKELFDYLHEEELSFAPNLEKKLAIAGNLDKSIFIEDWPTIMPELYAFGKKTKDLFGDNVFYQGSFCNEDLLKIMPKNFFGIAWDDKLPGGGDYQQYTRFNSPHKVSLYLSLGMPVVVWDESAIGEYIVKNKLGFTISHPKDIAEIFHTLDVEKLLEYKTNTHRTAKMLRNGMFTRKAIIEAENNIFLD